jgi:hypothetical protein
MRRLAMFLFLAGICAGAMLAIKPKIPWSLFTPALAVALAGVILFRLHTYKTSGGLPETKEIDGDLENLLTAITQELSVLIARDNNLETEEVKEKIEKIEMMIAEIVEKRNVFITHFGYETFSRIFVPLAQGERNLHRAWSALVDGYQEEIRRSLMEAEFSFRQALEAYRGIKEKD